jgi:hypothetical protein
MGCSEHDTGINDERRIKITSESDFIILSPAAVLKEYQAARSLGIYWKMNIMSTCMNLQSL